MQKTQRHFYYNMGFKKEEKTVILALQQGLQMSGNASLIKRNYNIQMCGNAAFIKLFQKGQIFSVFCCILL